MRFIKNLKVSEYSKEVNSHSKKRKESSTFLKSCKTGAHLLIKFSLQLGIWVLNIYLNTDVLQYS